MAEKKVIAYVDGYNLYEGCQSALRKPKDDSYTECYEELLDIMWYDPRKIVQHCGNGDFNDMKLPDIKIHFYTSRPDSGKKHNSGGKYNPGHYDRYIKALKKIDVKVIKGEFQPKRKKLNYDSIKNIIKELENILKSKQQNLTKQQKIASSKFESFLNDELKILYQKEKQTDVNLAIDMVTETDAHTVVLVSADSDFDPVIKKIIERKSNMNILILLPPVPEYEMADREERKKKIYKAAKAAAKGVRFSLNEKNFKITNIEIEDIEKCPLSEVTRERTEFDNKNKFNYCNCFKGECVKRGISII